MLHLIESRSMSSSGTVSLLEQQIARTQEQVNEQRKTIANLPVRSFEAGTARMQLLSLLENLAFLRKVSSA